MDRVYLKIPKDKVDRIIFIISLAIELSGNPVDYDEVIEIFKKEEIEIDKDLEARIKYTFFS